MRPTRDQWAMDLVHITATRSTCCRRRVGCVLMNSRGQVLATGYNGVASGMPHCNHVEPSETSWTHDPDRWLDHEKLNSEYPHACSAAFAPSGTQLDGCEAIHAEQNALLQCRDVYEIDTAYVSASPCVTCTKLLLNTSCQRVVFSQDYPHQAARELWERSGRKWKKF